MLSNLETEKSKLIQIVMIGQPQLRQKLSLRQLEQLRQRITVSYHLKPLDADETANYVNHRLKRAATGTPLVFPRNVTDLIHERSRGVPRIINVIADATLLFAYGIDRRDIDRLIVQEALAELDATGVLASYDAEYVEAAAASSVAIGDTEEALNQADEVRRREQFVTQRERQIAQREEALAAQRLVIAEEARLLEASRRQAGETAATTALLAAPAASLAPATVSATVPPQRARMLAADVSTTVARRAPMPTSFADRPIRVQAPNLVISAPPSTVWERLRRVLFGVEGTQTGS
jgi:general secretion pathway protein A